MAVASSRPATKRAVIIINPLSGRGRTDADIRAAIATATDLLRARGLDVIVRPTTVAGDANQFARDAVEQGAALVVAWGGDGTVNEAAAALAHTGVPLGIVPAGSGNGLASDLALPSSPNEALTVAATGRDLVIDAGQVHESLFFNIAGIGVDAVVATRFAERGMRRRGPLGYLQLGVSELLRYRAQEYGVTIDNERTDYRAMLIAIANGRQYGNNVCIAPGAKLDDGLLELVIVDELSTLSIAMRLPSLLRGTLRAGRGVSMRAVRECIVHAAGAIPFHVDGEPRVGPNEMRIRTLPGALVVRTSSRASQ